MPTLVRSVLGLYPLRWPSRALVHSWGAAPRCSVIWASNSSWSTLSTILCKTFESTSKIPCASVHPAYDDLRSSSLPFDRLTLGTNHLGGRWPFFLAPHRFTEVYGHNHPRQVPVRHLGDNDGLRCVFTHRSSSTFSVVAGRIATCCACAACKPLIGDAARPSKLAS